MPKLDKKSIVETKKEEPKSPPVFRLFECVIHLEIALAELKKVGIFQGENVEALQRQYKEVTAQVEDLYKEYLKQWGAMPKNA